MITYNHRPCIRQAVEGVVAQRAAFRFELVIGEECSTDGTREIVFELERKHPKIIRIVTSEKNVGARANSRRTREACSGKYYAYCEGDDYWHDPEKLARQVAFLEDHPDYGMVHSHAHFCDVGTGRVKENAFQCPEDLEDANAYTEILTRDREIVTASVCVRRCLLDTVIQQCPECTDTRFMMADTQRWLELARHAKVKCIHEPLVTKNSLPESATRSKDPSRILRFALNLRELYLHYLEKYPCPPALDAELRKQCAVMVLYRAYRAMDRAQAQAMWEELRKLRVQPPLKAWFYRLGVGSPLRQRFVRPGLQLMDYAERAAIRAGLKRPGALA
jgi:glycosyltransferase involved in cell wall biosynthesis